MIVWRTKEQLKFACQFQTYLADGGVAAGDGEAERGGLEVAELHALHDLQEARLHRGAVVLGVELLFFAILLILLVVIVVVLREVRKNQTKDNEGCT